MATFRWTTSFLPYFLKQNNLSSQRYTNPINLITPRHGKIAELERILNCCGLFEGKRPHPSPLPEGEGTTKHQ